MAAAEPVPSGVGPRLARNQAGAVKPEAVQQALEQWRAAQAGEHAPSMVRKGLVLTESQLDEINRAYAKLTGGKQPPGASRELDIATGHIFDARISGKPKASGRTADSFTPEEVARWLPVAGADDAAVALNKNGKPYLSNSYVDPRTGERIPLELPISSDFTTGKQWVEGLVPRGKTKGPRPR